jgi:hypothetical protein
LSRFGARTVRPHRFFSIPLVQNASAFDPKSGGWRL